MSPDNLTILKNPAPLRPPQLALDGFLLDRQAVHCTRKNLGVPQPSSSVKVSRTQTRFQFI